MNIKRQVTSLDVSQKLKLLNVKQESLFYWDKVHFDFSLWKIGDVTSWGMEESYDKPSPESFSAFTVTELLEILGKNTRLSNVSENNYYVCTVNKDGEKTVIHTTEDYYAAESLGKMLIYILEHGIIKASEL